MILKMDMWKLCECGNEPHLHNNMFTVNKFSVSNGEGMGSDEYYKERKGC